MRKNFLVTVKKLRETKPTFTLLLLFFLLFLFDDFVKLFLHLRHLQRTILTSLALLIVFQSLSFYTSASITGLEANCTIGSRLSLAIGFSKCALVLPFPGPFPYSLGFLRGRFLVRYCLFSTLVTFMGKLANFLTSPSSNMRMIVSSRSHITRITHLLGLLSCSAPSKLLLAGRKTTSSHYPLKNARICNLVRALPPCSLITG